MNANVHGGLKIVSAQLLIDGKFTDSESGAWQDCGRCWF